MNKILLECLRFRRRQVRTLFLTPMMMMLIFSLHAFQTQAADTVSEKISLNFRNAPLKEVFQDIEHKTGYRFFYSTRAINEKHRVTINLKDAPIRMVVDDMLRGLPVTYTIQGDQILLRSTRAKDQAALPLPDETITAPEDNPIPADTREQSVNVTPAVTVSGIVTSETGESMPGVNVIEKGTANGTTTDVDGKYTFSITDGSAVLTFSFIGYLTKEIAVSNMSQINVTMDPDITTLGEIVVVGYGTQKKVSVTNSVSQVKTEALTQRPASTLTQTLQGQAPGLTIIDQGGMPGRPNTTIRVRGVNSLPDASNPNKNSALVIVDGIEQSMDFINPNDIESISVLKDAASTAIYGSRAANGVVLVTTKRAKEGKVVVNYNGYYALQQSMNNPEMMEVGDYMRLQQVAFTNAGLAVPDLYSDASIDLWRNSNDREKYPLPNVWYKKLFKTAPQYSNSISVAGGSETFKARMSARQLRQDALIDGYDFDLKEVRLSTDFKASKKISFSGDFNYRRNHAETPTQEGTIYDRIFHGSLFAVPQYGDGTYGLSSQLHNPLMYAALGGHTNQYVENIIGNLSASWTIVEGLKFTTQFSPRIILMRQKAFTGAYTNTDKVKNLTKVVQPNSLTETRVNVTEYTFNNLLTYEKDFGRHNVTALIGYSEISNMTDSLTAYRQQFYNNEITSIGQGANDGTKSNGGSDTRWGLRSYFARVNYGFADKYLLEAAVRYDGSSRFTGDKQYGFFPSFSAGWRMSEEPFLRDVSFLQELKLRGSWGQTGNQSVALYNYYSALQSSAYSFGNTSVIGYKPNLLTNPNLTWETTSQTNVGIDAQLFERLNISFDYYKKRTDNIHIRLPIPATIGLVAPFQNAGVVDNTGFEAVAGYRGEIVSGLTFGVDGNFAVNNNKVVSLAGTGPYITGSDIDPRYVIREGSPINAHWGYQTDGLFQTQDEVNAYPTYAANSKPGDVKYVDRNDDKQINADDMMVIGTSFPKYTYGLTLSLGYKAFQLSAFLQGAADIDTRLAGALAEMGNNEGFVSDVVTNNYWTPENPNAQFSRPVKRDLRNTNTSDRMIIDASYVKLKNIQLTYNLPSSLLERVYMTKANIYFSATNVLTFSKLKEWGLDPEVGSGRALYYPQTSLLTLGTNITF